jgi:hypothetical protein
MPDAEPTQGFRIAPRSEGRAVVGHDALDGEAMPAEEAQGVEQEAQAGAALLVGQDLRIGQSGMVVDGPVKVFPADAPAVALAGAIAGDPMARSLEASFLMSMWINSPGRSRS